MIELLSITNNCEHICELGARTCYDSVDKIDSNNKSLINALLKSGHLSVFEHASATFHISNISRTASHQLVRHRLASFSQKSQRYVNENDFDMIIPESIKKDNRASVLLDTHISQVKVLYNHLVDLGVKKEDARFVLPNGISTELVMTANFREWLHIIDVRVSKGAQWEIRDLMTEIWSKLYEYAPNVFNLTYFESFSKDIEYKRNIFESF